MCLHFSFALFSVGAVTLIIAHVISGLGSAINKRRTSKLCYKAVFIVPRSRREKIKSLQADNRMMQFSFSCHYGFTSATLVHPRKQPLLLNVVEHTVSRANSLG